MAKHNEINDESARYQIFQSHVDCILAANAQNLSCSLKVNEFAAFERVEARGLTRLIPVVMLCSWTTAMLSSRREHHVHGGQLPLYRNRRNL